MPSYEFPADVERLIGEYADSVVYDVLLGENALTENEKKTHAKKKNGLFFKRMKSYYMKRMKQQFGLIVPAHEKQFVRFYKKLNTWFAEGRRTFKNALWKLTPGPRYNAARKKALVEAEYTIVNPRVVMNCIDRPVDEGAKCYTYRALFKAVVDTRKAVGQNTCFDWLYRRFQQEAEVISRRIEFFQWKAGVFVKAMKKYGPSMRGNPHEPYRKARVYYKICVLKKRKTEIINKYARIIYPRFLRNSQLSSRINRDFVPLKERYYKARVTKKAYRYGKSRWLWKLGALVNQF